MTLSRMCTSLISAYTASIRGSVLLVEKALLALVFMAYLQAFNDGNKRTGRVLANALLHARSSLPLSLRTVGEDDYRHAIVAF